MNGVECSPECWKIIHVPEKPPVLPQHQPTVDVLASTIEARHANTIVRKLNHIAPLQGLRHVKRVRKLHLGGNSQLLVILCLASGTSDESSSMPEEVKELVKTYQLSSFDAKVSKFAALTKDEWEEQCKLWPTSFHPPTYNIEGITGFSEEQSKSILSFMKLAISMSKSRNRVYNAAIIVDPSTSQIIASVCDQVHSENEDLVNSNDTERCSTNHFEPVRTNGEEREPYKGVACLHPWDWIEQLPYSSSGSCHPLRHAAVEAIEKSAARDIQLFPLNGDYTESDHALSPSRESMMRNLGIQDLIYALVMTSTLSLNPLDVYLLLVVLGVLWRLFIRESDVCSTPFETRTMVLWEAFIDCKEKGV